MALDAVGLCVSYIPVNVLVQMEEVSLASPKKKFVIHISLLFLSIRSLKPTRKEEGRLDTQTVSESGCSRQIFGTLTVEMARKKNVHLVSRMFSFVMGATLFRKCKLLFFAKNTNLRNFREN